MRFDALKAALLTVGVPVSHYVAYKQTDKYIVWAEDGQAGSQCGDDGATNQIVQGTVDYFTKAEYDENVGAIQTVMNGVVSWRLNSVQYEDDTGYIHYEWVWESVHGV